jgi:hypothetical protein
MSYPSYRSTGAVPGADAGASSERGEAVLIEREVADTVDNVRWRSKKDVWKIWPLGQRFQMSLFAIEWRQSSMLDCCEFHKWIDELVGDRCGYCIGANLNEATADYFGVFYVSGSRLSVKNLRTTFGSVHARESSLMEGSVVSSVWMRVFCPRHGMEGAFREHFKTKCEGYDEFVEVMSQIFNGRLLKVRSRVVESGV